MTTQVIQFKHTRICQYCHDHIPDERGGTKPHHRAQVKYCGKNCSRKAVYHRKTFAEKAEINKRSNDRRMEKDLLPYLRSLQRTKGDLNHCPEAIRHFALKVILIESYRDWRLRSVLGFNKAREALIELAGDADTLEEIEFELMETAIALRTQGNSQ